jgi:peptidoglycan/xylan/chitin deacetylase (PgdA/CDA1 family)
MSFLKKLARKVVFPLIHNFHLDYLFGYMSPNNSMILCFHGVTAHPHFALNNRHMPVEQFDRLIRYISTHYDVIGVDELFGDLPAPKRNGNRKRLCLTFDDGYLNNLTTALPILEKYGVHATFYIITEGLKQPDFMVWTDLLDFILLNTDNPVITIAEYRFERRGTNFFCPVLNGISISDYLKTTGPEKYPLLQELADGIPAFKASATAFPDYWKLMTAADLKTFAASSCVTIGSHTVHHHNLASIDPEMVRNELVQSKTELEDLLQKTVSSIAYPDGSYTTSVIDVAEEIGYREQLAVDYRQPEDPSDPRIQARLSISNSTTYQSNLFRINTGFARIGF